DDTGTGSTRHDILSRFSVNPANANQGLSGSEVKFIRQRDEANNHNAGDLQFGPDGYLYVPVGDEGGGDGVIGGVPSGNAQNITNDFFSGILRIDVDKKLGNLNPNPHVGIVAPTNYAIPADNPFLNRTIFNGSVINSNTVRTEFWVVGLRNPWRISFDPPTGFLYGADVGQNVLEEVNIIRRGSNYGWNFYEGTIQRTNPTPAGFVNTPPILQFGHTNSQNAIVGGHVHRGQRLTQLYGQYVYGDYGSGRIYALTYNGTNVTQNSFLFADAPLSTFGVDPGNGDILYANLGAATNAVIRRIIYNTTTNGAPLPPTLADTGAFSNLTTLGASPGVVPYDVNVPFWSDGAIKSRWFSLPNTNLTITFSREGNWLFPTGTVWVKHFELELTNGVPASRKRLETRLLVKNAAGGYGVTYRWGNSLTNATLVGEEGLDESFVINDGGVLRTQVWHYPTRAECLQCHNNTAGFALGFSTPQLNRDFDYSGTVTNQIAALSQAGYFNTNVTGIHTLRAMAHATNSQVSLEYRVRSYLAANCVQCHQPSGAAQALWDARLLTTTASAGLINGPLISSGGSTNVHVLTPGSITNSMLLTRISTRGLGQMPPLATSVLDTQAITLVSAWVTNDLPSWQSFANWQIAQFGSTNAPNSGATQDADLDGAKNYLEYLTGTNPNSTNSFWSIAVQRAGNAVQIVYPQSANRAFEVQSASSPFSSAAWQALDVSGNEPFFAISNRITVVSDSDSAQTNKFYRVRVFEP
ncbi:MAG: hypothetical protein EPO07_15805, partial [Verrucomicrobia bacterium]